jgi:uncharacterized ferritin-like protein (DUF455 family)
LKLRDFASSLLAAETLDGKLAPPPDDLVDELGGTEPGSVPPSSPRRPPGLEIRSGGDVRVPPAVAWPDIAQRVRILHALANHELQAAELFAWAVLAFPDAPPAMRRGWLRILADEQRHCAMYVARLAAHGARFGDFPVSGHFWRKAKDLATPLQFNCAMGLTFENANLDFTGDYVAAARAAKDEESARVLLAVHADEVHHVRFAWEWLVKLKDPSQSAWDAYVAQVPPPHGPRRARGADFDKASRVAAGFDEDFIARLEATSAEAPGGARRK